MTSAMISKSLIALYFSTLHYRKYISLSIIKNTVFSFIIFFKKIKIKIIKNILGVNLSLPLFTFSNGLNGPFRR